RIAPLALALILLAAPSAQAQAVAEVWVRVVSVGASGNLEDDQERDIPEALDALDDVLQRMNHAAFARLAWQVLSQPSNTQFAFTLPLERRLTVDATPVDDDRLEVRVELFHTPPPGTETKRVVGMVVRMDDGGSYVIQRPGIWEEGDLLLIVTASRSELE
ncbi:hypothetical protein OAX78_04135, partial [Planctomycetota bacterium]|nr:hypothetical protein [Planctomycetota bacterium]